MLPEPKLDSPSPRDVPHTLHLVSEALKQNSLRGLGEMLKGIALALEAHGCILWSLDPLSFSDSSDGTLSVVAQWFSSPPTHMVQHLPLGSMVGKSIADNQTLSSTDARNDSRVYQGDFISHNGITGLCCAPLRFHDGTAGAVCVYRQHHEPFVSTTTAQLEHFALILPGLYEAICNRVGLALITQINAVLHHSDPVKATSPNREISRNLARVCDLLSDTFDNLETSIFLEDPAREPGIYRLQATSWRGEFPRPILTKSDTGLTAWVLNNCRAVRLFDLEHFHDNLHLIHRQYPGLTWEGSLGIVRHVREYLAIGVHDETPPVGLIAAPIRTHDAVLGVVRCSVRKVASYAFRADDLALLEVVAAEIASAWSKWLTDRENEAEKLAWRKLVQSVGQFNRWMHDELSGGPLDKHTMFAEGLRIAPSVLGGAELTDVRLFDEKTKELYFFVTSGAAWDLGTTGEAKARKGRRYPVDQDAQSPGVQAFLSGETVLLDNIDHDPDSARAFPEVRQMIIAPIRSADRVYGVLDIRRTLPEPFPRHAQSIVELIGLLMGLYNGIREIKDTLVRTHQAQIRTHRFLAHQIRQPITRAYSILRGLRAGVSSHEQFMNGLASARALVRSARRVSMGVKMFADLSHQKPLNIRLRSFLIEQLLRLLVGGAADYELIFKKSQRVTFVVNRGSFRDLPVQRVRMDPHLLEQALANLLDNAGKYSYQDTAVSVSGRLVETQWLVITIANKGLPMTLQEVEVCATYGWRGETGRSWWEGEGTGLWIADQVARAHKGRLQVNPTATDGFTRVELYFPISGVLQT